MGDRPLDRGVVALDLGLGPARLEQEDTLVGDEHRQVVQMRIFVLVVAIVLFGLWLTWLQFTRDQGHEVRRFKRAVRQSAEQLDECFEMDHHMQGIDVPFERLGLI